MPQYASGNGSDVQGEIIAPEQNGNMCENIIARHIFLWTA
jgi:hypothetical protein